MTIILFFRFDEIMRLGSQWIGQILCFQHRLKVSFLIRWIDGVHNRPNANISPKVAQVSVDLDEKKKEVETIDIIHSVEYWYIQMHSRIVFVFMQVNHTDTQNKSDNIAIEGAQCRDKQRWIA